MSGKQGRECPVVPGRESLRITCSLDDTVRAEVVEVVSPQARPLLKTAVETGPAKQKDSQMEQAISSPSLGPRSCGQAAPLMVPSGMSDSPHLHLSRSRLRRQTDGRKGNMAGREE